MEVLHMPPFFSHWLPSIPPPTPTQNVYYFNDTNTYMILSIRQYLKNMKKYSIDNVEITVQQTLHPTVPLFTHFQKEHSLTCALFLLVAISITWIIILHLPKYKDLLHKGEKKLPSPKSILKVCNIWKKGL